MASPAYEQILKLQEIDLTLRQLNHRFDNHELRQKVVESKVKLEKRQATIQAIMAKVDENSKEQRSLQRTVGDLESKRDSARSKLFGGSVTVPKELLTLEEEAAGFDLKISGFEDQLLELMEGSEELHGQLASAETASTDAETYLAEVEAGLQVALEEIDSQRSEITSNRGPLADGCDPELLRRYESLAPQYDGVALARLVNGGCDGCHIQLSIVALDEINRLDESAVVTCEECGRLLVR